MDGTGATNAPGSATTNATINGVKPMKATSAPVVARATEPADETVVNFTDAVLKARVVQALNLTAGSQVTIGDIRRAPVDRYGVLRIYPVLNSTLDPYPISSLVGMEAFQYLNGYLVFGTGIDATNGFDLTPLQNLKFKELYLETPYFSRVDLSPLSQIDPVPMQIISLTGETGRYNQQGMNNQQLKQLSGWLTQVMNTGADKNYRAGFLQIALSYNAISDFSSLAGINPNIDDATNGGAWITAFNQVQTVSNPTLNIVAGQPVTFDAAKVVGVHGEQLTSDVLYTYLGQEITQLANGQYTIADPEATGNFFSYGQLYRNYLDIYYGTTGISPGLRLQTNVMYLQQANWQAYPTITVEYVNQATGQTIQQTTTFGDASTMIGDQLTLDTAVAGYQVVASSVPTNLVYSATPQTIRLYYRQLAGDLTVSFVDRETGATLKSDQSFTGQLVGDTPASYTHLTPPKIYRG